IPFLEHDDANRALMGSNMQRQAVPLLITEPPLVATGLEKEVAKNSGMVIKSEKAGTVTHVDAARIKVDEREYVLRKFVGLGERGGGSQKAVGKVGQEVKEGEVRGGGAGGEDGEGWRGRKGVVGFGAGGGGNGEEAGRGRGGGGREGTYTSIHIEE